MTAIITPAEITAHLESMTAVELRKLGGTMGIKGASKGKKAELVAAIAEIRIREAEELAVAEKLAAAEVPVELSDEEAAKKARRSRRGMVIVAKGTEVHKSQTFKEAAEAAGWKVTILGSVVTEVSEEDGEEYEIERFVARATKDDDLIELAWNGKAYDYPTSHAALNGKARKVRNLKEALRILAGQA